MVVDVVAELLVIEAPVSEEDDNEAAGNDDNDEVAGCGEGVAFVRGYVFAGLTGRLVLRAAAALVIIRKSIKYEENLRKNMLREKRVCGYEFK